MTTDAEDETFITRGRKIDIAVAMFCIGPYVLLISLFADVLGFGSAQGFGWQQWMGVLIAGAIGLAGAIVRAPTLWTIGMFVGGVTVLADWLGLGSAPGFGWQQVLGSALGVALILIGVTRSP